MLNNRGFLNVDLLISLIIFSFIVLILSQTYVTSIKAINKFYEVADAMGDFEAYIMNIDNEELCIYDEVVQNNGEYSYELKVLQNKKEYLVLSCKMYKQGDIYEEFKKIKRK